MEHKSVAFELKKEPDEDGVFEGYASVFGVVDQGMDVVERGAFTKSLGSGRNVKMLWQHDSAQPIGVFDVMQEDERGLFVRGRLLKGIKQSEEAMVLMRAGAIDSMSIGYRVSEAAEEGGGRIRKLMHVDLFEISLVTFPMLEVAKITAMKSITTIREFEKALRDAGFSKTEAKAIAADGFKGLSDHRDDVEDDAETIAENLAFQSEIQKLMEAFNV
jgi:HK97 family phage prohead protease